MDHFTPFSAAFGGILIGLAAAWLWLSLGRVAGISGIAGNLGADGGRWRMTFLLGLIVAGPLMALFGYDVPWHAPAASWPVLVVGGLLVGFGTRLGSGCTSGHGVCGMARLSPRSLVATLTFMLTAALMVFLVRHGGWR